MNAVGRKGATPEQIETGLKASGITLQMVGLAGLVTLVALACIVTPHISPLITCGARRRSFSNNPRRTRY